MNEQLHHDDIAELLAVYALDAVEGHEREAVEEHLRVCPRCRAELANHREVTAMLAHTGAPAPDGLWDRIAESIDEPAPDTALGHVLSMEDRRRRPSWPLAVLGAAAVFVVAILSVAVWQLSDEVDSVKDSPIEQAAKAALDEPGRQLVDLASDDGRIHARVVITPDGRGYIYEDSMPALSTDETWQLWGISGDEAISLGVLGNDPDTSSFRVEGDVDALAVTREKTGGVVQSEEPPSALGTVA